MPIIFKLKQLITRRELLQKKNLKIYEPVPCIILIIIEQRWQLGAITKRHVGKLSILNLNFIGETVIYN